MERPFLLDNVWDLGVLLDYLETRPDVDAARIGITGVSLGGMHSWLAAALDARIAVAAPMIGVQACPVPVHFTANAKHATGAFMPLHCCCTRRINLCVTAQTLISCELLCWTVLWLGSGARQVAREGRQHPQGVQGGRCRHGQKGGGRRCGPSSVEPAAAGPAGGKGTFLQGLFMRSISTHAWPK